MHFRNTNVNFKNVNTIGMRTLMDTIGQKHIVFNCCCYEKKTAQYFPKFEMEYDQY